MAQNIFDLIQEVYNSYIKASRKEELSRQVRELIEKVGANCNGCQLYEDWSPEEERVTVWIEIESAREKLEEIARWLNARNFAIIAMAPYKCKGHSYNDEEKKLKEQLGLETCGTSTTFDIVLAKEGEAALVIRFFYDEEEDP